MSLLACRLFIRPRPLFSRPRFFVATKAAKENKPASKEGKADTVAINIDSVTKRFETTGRTLFANVSLSFLEGAKIGILGANGAGKSSLLKIIGGVEPAFDGTVTVNGARKVGYLHQEPVMSSASTVREVVEEGVKAQREWLQRYESISAQLSDPAVSEDTMNALISEQADLQTLLDDKRSWELDTQIAMAMTALRCPDADRHVAGLSGGEKRRVALCRLLLSHPDVLLLDEPTNHLDATSVEWLEKFLDEYKGLVIAITHDRYFLDSVAGYILELTEGRCLPFKGNYTDWLETKEDRVQRETKQNKAVDKVIKRELEWLRSGTKGGRTKGKAREKNLKAMVASKTERLLNQRIESGALIIPEGHHLRSNQAIQADGLKMSINGRVLFQNLSFRFGQGDVVGIVGPNGAGKTTLLRVIAGELEPEAGHIRIDEGIRFAYNTQLRSELEPANTVWYEIVGNEQNIRVNTTTEMPARRYVAQFNFSGTQQEKRVVDCSGGERNRIHLAKSLIVGANAILLDEPTNDLDVDTLRKLEEALIDFQSVGLVVIVSHDRWFLDRVCNKIIALEPSGPISFDGNHSAFRAAYGTTGSTSQHKKLMY
jgi:ATP-binding cassette ChvD family protein